LENIRNFVDEALLHGKRGDLLLRNYKNPIFPFHPFILVGYSRLKIKLYVQKNHLFRLYV
jgi:hypothetical protein